MALTPAIWTDDKGIPHLTAPLEIRVPLMLFPNQQPEVSWPVPTGSIIKTDSKWGHELIAGPFLEGQQLVGHGEPGIGKHPETFDSAAQRYNFTGYVPPVSEEHGAESWNGMVAQFGEPWLPFDHCRDAASKAYYGRPESPFYVAVVGVAVFFWLISRNRN